jgi:hypothetical protein
MKELTETEALAMETARLLSALFAEEQKRFSKIDPPNLKDVHHLKVAPSIN